jgi:hypothetical protein
MQISQDGFGKKEKPKLGSNAHIERHTQRPVVEEIEMLLVILHLVMRKRSKVMS